ncbi:MAG: hypothetical protein EOP05_15640 [Proteobacteria bacterium]|nr:MAG: hypothetical protein EOP05_15640 [Pseudomonadota bacterium]
MRNRLNIEGSYLIRSQGLASFTAEGLLVDRPKVYGLKGWTGLLAWTAWILVVMAGPVQTSAFSDRTEPTVNVCQAH